MEETKDADHEENLQMYIKILCKKKKLSKLNFGEITLKKEMKMCDCEVTSSDRASMVENPPEQQFFRSSLTPKVKIQ